MKRDQPPGQTPTSYEAWRMAHQVHVRRAFDAHPGLAVAFAPDGSVLAVGPDELTLADRLTPEQQATCEVIREILPLTPSELRQSRSSRRRSVARARGGHGRGAA